MYFDHSLPPHSCPSSFWIHLPPPHSCPLFVCVVLICNPLSPMCAGHVLLTVWDHTLGETNSLSPKPSMSTAAPLEMEAVGPPPQGWTVCRLARCCTGLVQAVIAM